MTAELGRVIAAVLAAAGEGMASLRDRGTGVELSDCSIEVMVEEDSAPSAHVKLRLESHATSKLPAVQNRGDSV